VRTPGYVRRMDTVAAYGSSVYWLESRPAEGGRVVFVRADGTGADGAGTGVVDVTPAGVSIRSRVHEYGGGACCLVPRHGPGAFAYVDGGDRRRANAGRTGDSAPARTGTWRRGGGPGPRRSIVALGTLPENAGESILAQGHDFYGAPRLDTTARRVAMAVWDQVVTPLEVSVDRSTGTSSPVTTSRWGSRRGSATALCGSFRIASGGGSPTSMPAFPTVDPPWP
jgi:hypothetical protein